MLFRGNIAVATALLTLLATLAPITAAGAPPSTAPPSPTEAMEAYRTVRGWIDAGGPPSGAPDAGPRAPAGACVTIRLEGRVIGRGLAFAEGGNNLHAAATGAWSAAIERLGEKLGARADETALDLELAGAFVPLVGETELDFLAQLNPGVDGLAVRAGERIGVTYPGQMLASAWTPAQALAHAIARLDLPPLDFPTLKNRYGLVVYRFETEHLAQPAARAEPVFLERGGRSVPLGEINGGRILEAAGNAASFLIRLEWPGPEPHGLRGDYDPIADVYEPTIAPPASQAIAAWALAVYGSTPGVDPADAARASRTARRLIADFTLATEFEEDPAIDPGALALWRVALDLLGGPAVFGDEEVSERVRVFAADVLDALMELTDDAEARTELPGGVRALVALALVHASDEPGRGDACRERAEELARWLYVETEPGDLVGLMPWLGLASVELAGEGDPGAAGTLREMRSIVQRFTLRAQETDAGTADLAGGVVFTRGRTPLPSWQSLRPVAFLAVMAGDAGLTPEHDRTEAWMTLIESLRFVIQLQADSSNGHMFVRPGAASGGVRLALWDQRCGVSATALGLVCLCEAIRSAERAAGMQR